MSGGRRPRWRWRGLVGLACGAVSILACGGDTTGPGPLTPAQAYWALQLNYHAVTFALTGSQDTLRLVATPRNVLGDSLSIAGTVHFSTTDSMVTVDSTGLVKAKFVTPGTKKATVVASLTDPAQHVTLVDTCYFQVKATTPSLPLANFTILPAAGSDTVGALGTFPTMKTTATNANNGTVATFPAYRSSNPHIAAIDVLTGKVSPKLTGQVWFFAKTWAYGVAKRDSLSFRVGVPSSIKISVISATPTGSTHPVLTFWPQTVTLLAGATVIWQNPSLTDSMDVVFDDPTNVDSASFGAAFGFGSGEGNIAPWVQDLTGSSDIGAAICMHYNLVPPNCGALEGVIQFQMQRRRTFPVPGTYHYHSSIWGATGTIVVVQ